MDDKLKNIDTYYKNHLADHAQEMESDIWKNLRWSLFWIRYRWKLGIGFILLLLGLGGFFYMGIDSPAKHIDNQNGISAAENNQNTNSIFNDIDITNIEKKNIITNRDENNTTESDAKPASTISGNFAISLNSGITKIINNELKHIDKKNIRIENRENVYELTNRLDGIERKNRTESISIEPDTTFGNNVYNVSNIDKLNSKQRFSFSIFAGPSYSQFELTGNDSEYLDFRKDNENSHCGWSAGAELKFYIKNFVITTGLNYSVVITKFFI